MMNVNITGLLKCMRMEDINKSQDNFAQFSRLPSPAIQVRRYDNRQHRFYFWQELEGDKMVVKTAIGVTSLLSAVMPTSPYLIQWKMEAKDAEKELAAASEYGTLLHCVYAEWLIKKEINRDLVEQARKIAIEFGGGSEVIDKDILSLMKFCEDYNPKILLSEAMLVSEPIQGQRYCLTIDLLCELEVEETRIEIVQNGFYLKGANKGKPKTTEKKVTEKVVKVALIDFKSNLQAKQNKSFYKSHFFQLLAGKRAVEHNYPSIRVDMIANLSPNGWRTNPSYSFKVWPITEADNKALDTYVELARIEGLLVPSGSTFIPPAFTPTTKSTDYELLDYVSFVEKYLLNAPEEPYIEEVLPDSILSKI
jgi:hypothetical protein